MVRGFLCVSRTCRVLFAAVMKSAGRSPAASGYSDRSFAIPSIDLNDWPDQSIHTNFDTPAMIDPTTLLRAAFIAAASGLAPPNVTDADLPDAFTPRPRKGRLRDRSFGT